MSAQSSSAAMSRCVQTRVSIPAAIAGVVGCPPASLVSFKLTHYPVDDSVAMMRKPVMISGSMATTVSAWLTHGWSSCS